MRCCRVYRTRQDVHFPFCRHGKIKFRSDPTFLQQFARQMAIHWTFRPKPWTIRPRMMNVSSKTDGRFGQIFNSFTETNDTHYRKQSFRYFACRLLRWQQQAASYSCRRQSSILQINLGSNIIILAETSIIICLPISRQNKPSVRSKMYRSFDYRDN